MGPGEVKNLHGAIAKGASLLIGAKASIVPRSTLAWEKAGSDKVCDFELFPDNPADGETAFRGRRRERVSVLPLYPSESWSDNSYWVSWYEKWQKLRQPGFALLTASWTVYRGIRSQTDKAQLVRADWDQPSSNEGTRDAGQPHWHFDQPVAVSIAIPHELSRASLREMPPLYAGSPAITQTTGQQAIDYVHLAMGTWNPGCTSPKCWQRAARTWRDISDWAIRTLEYLHGQFGRR